MLFPRSFFFGLMAFLYLIHAGCQGKSATQDRVEKLLRTAENPSLRLDERGEAVRELGARKEKAVVPQLIRILDEHDSDVLGDEIIFALGEIGDPNALPALLHVRDKESVDGFLPGQIRVNLDRSIETLEKKSR